MKTTVKKLTALLMSVLLITLCGCSGQRKGSTIDIITDEGTKTVPLVRMVMDVGEINNLAFEMREVPGNGRDFQITYEAVPWDEPERSSYLNRIKTEMMAGEGPDLFLIDMSFSNMRVDEHDKPQKALFAYPEKAMKNRLFLPLDEYMEKAEFTDFSALMPELMDICKNEDGQQFIPVTYSFGMGVFDTDLIDIPEGSTDTREAMLESGVPALEFFARSNCFMPLEYFAEDADFIEETLSFTEEELCEQAMLWWESRKTVRIAGLSYGPASNDFCSPGEGKEVVTQRNSSGGVTAYVGLAWAVNRNTAYPEEAFKVIDKLSSESVMRGNLFNGLAWGLPANTQLGGRDKPIAWRPTMSDDRTLPEITAAKFPTGLEQAAYELLLKCIRGSIKDEAAVKDASHKAYTTMKMMLAES